MVSRSIQSKISATMSRKKRVQLLLLVNVILLVVINTAFLQQRLQTPPPVIEASGALWRPVERETKPQPQPQPKPQPQEQEQEQEKRPQNEHIPEPIEQGHESQFCCGIVLKENAAHGLTDFPFQLNQCGPIIHLPLSFNFSSKETVKFSKKASDLIEIYNKTVTSDDECREYYTQFPEQHPKQHYPHTLAIMAEAQNSSYDAYEIGRNLREAQKKMLSACGLKPPIFKSEIGPESSKAVNSRIYERLENGRPPVKRVLILVRHPMRKLSNAQDLLPICSDLKVDCQVIYMDKYWSKEESSDLCYALKTFEDSMVIGMQGADMIYPLLLGQRLILVSAGEKEVIDNHIDRRHYGKPLSEMIDEVQEAKNLVRSSGTYLLDPFYPEFALHFGAELDAVSGKWLDPAESDIPSKVEIILKTHQCHPAKGAHTKVEGIHDYCLDRDINVADTKLILEKYIKDGHLLLLGNETKSIA